MRVLGEQDDLLLHITWNDGEDIWITSDFVANEPQRVYYPLEELVDMDLTEQPEEQGTGTPGKVNPPTGGILEISAPVPYSEAVHNTGKTADASLARPSENAHAAEETDTAKPESGNSLALTAAAIVVLAARRSWILVLEEEISGLILLIPIKTALLSAGLFFCF